MENIPQQPEQEVLDNSVFSINTWFNNLPIRIIGTPDEPFFYAADIAAVLGIKNVSMSIKNFDQEDIVSPEMRARYNLITYKQYKKGPRQDDSVVLLTEDGAYRLIFGSRCVLAREFRRHIAAIIREARLKEVNKLKIIEPEKLQAMTAELADARAIIKRYQKYNPAIYVFEKLVDGNPCKHILREDRDYDIKDAEHCERLYKFTTKPNASDYSGYNLYAEIYGNSDQIMDSLFDECLDINPKSLEYCRYIPDCDFDDHDFCDFSNCKIVYM